MVEDAADDVWLCDEADDTHLAGASGADEWIDLVDAAQQVGPALTGSLDGGGGRLGLIRTFGLAGAGLASRGPTSLSPGSIGVEAVMVVGLPTCGEFGARAS
jgi:hypothetical protein